VFAVVLNIHDLAARLSNWGRWGESDQLGTLNYISNAKIIEAARLVRTGQVIELGIPLGPDGPQVGRPRKFNPLHFMTALPLEEVRPDGIGIADDVLMMPTQSATHWDALSHIAYRGELYGGRSAGDVRNSGASVNSIQTISSRVVSRGVLVDMPRVIGVDSLQPAQPITARDLSQALSREHTDIGEGDFLLVRTGFMERCRRDGWREYFGDAPGIDIDAIEWLHERRIAGVAADTIAVEVKPSTLAGVSLPVHVLGIVYMGLLIGEMFDLEALANECETDERYDFMFVAPPLPIRGGVGSPINPYALR
jgi:kynurenine formamidase